MRRGAGAVVLRLESLSQSRYLSDRHVRQHLEGAFRDGSGPGALPPETAAPRQQDG